MRAHGEPDAKVLLDRDASDVAEGGGAAAQQLHQLDPDLLGRVGRIEDAACGLVLGRRRQRHRVLLGQAPDEHAQLHAVQLQGVHQWRRRRSDDERGRLLIRSGADHASSSGSVHFSQSGSRFPWKSRRFFHYFSSGPPF